MHETNFELGYFIGNHRFNITNELHLAKAMSLEKKKISYVLDGWTPCQHKRGNLTKVGQVHEHQEDILTR